MKTRLILILSFSFLANAQPIPPKEGSADADGMTWVNHCEHQIRLKGKWEDLLVMEYTNAVLEERPEIPDTELTELITIAQRKIEAEIETSFEPDVYGEFILDDNLRTQHARLYTGQRKIMEAGLRAFGSVPVPGNPGNFTLRMIELTEAVSEYSYLEFQGSDSDVYLESQKNAFQKYQRSQERMDLTLAQFYLNTKDRPGFRSDVEAIFRKTGFLAPGTPRAEIHKHPDFQNVVQLNKITNIENSLNTALGEIHGKIDEQNKKLASLTQDQEGIVKSWFQNAKDPDQAKKEKQAKEDLKHKKRLATLRLSVKQVAAAARVLGDSNAATKVSQFGNAAILIYDAGYQLEKFSKLAGAFNPAMIIGAATTVGAIVGAVQGVMALFGGGSSSIEQILLSQIQKLHQKVDNLYKFNKSRFDAIDAKLSQIFETMVSEFAIVNGKLDTILARLEQVQIRLDEVYNEVSQIRIALKEIEGAKIERELAKLVYECVSRKGEEKLQTKSELDRCLSELSFIALQSANSAGSGEWKGQYEDIGLTEFALPFPAIGSLPEVGYALAQNGARIDDLLSGLPKPLEWALAANAMTQTLRSNPNAVLDQADLGRVETTLAIGEKISWALNRALYPKGETEGKNTYEGSVFATLSKQARSSLADLRKAFNSQRIKYARKNAEGEDDKNSKFVDPWGGTKQPQSMMGVSRDPYAPLCPHFQWNHDFHWLDRMAPNPGDVGLNQHGYHQYRNKILFKSDVAEIKRGFNLWFDDLRKEGRLKNVPTPTGADYMFSPEIVRLAKNPNLSLVSNPTVCVEQMGLRNIIHMDQSGRRTSMGDLVIQFVATVDVPGMGKVNVSRAKVTVPGSVFGEHSLVPLHGTVFPSKPMAHGPGMKRPIDIYNHHWGERGDVRAIPARGAQYIFHNPEGRKATHEFWVDQAGLARIESAVSKKLYSLRAVKIKEFANSSRFQKLKEKYMRQARLIKAMLALTLPKSLENIDAMRTLSFGALPGSEGSVRFIPDTTRDLNTLIVGDPNAALDFGKPGRPETKGLDHLDSMLKVYYERPAILEENPWIASSKGALERTKRWVETSRIREPVGEVISRLQSEITQYFREN